jgi:hypothetical protein
MWPSFISLRAVAAVNPIIAATSLASIPTGSVERSLVKLHHLCSSKGNFDCKDTQTPPIGAYYNYFLHKLFSFQLYA